MVGQHSQLGCIAEFCYQGKNNYQEMFEVWQPHEQLGCDIVLDHNVYMNDRLSKYGLLLWWRMNFSVVHESDPENFRLENFCDLAAKSLDSRLVLGGRKANDS